VEDVTKQKASETGEKVECADPRSGSRSTEETSLLTRKSAMIIHIFRKHVMKAHPARLASIMGRATHCPTLAVACSEIVAAVDTELFPQDNWWHALRGE
jgi:hypothetical protein